MLQSRYEQTFAAQADKGVNNILKSRGLPDACGSVQCPHCRWGFSRAVIAQHVREKHYQAALTAARRIIQADAAKELAS